MTYSTMTRSLLGMADHLRGLGVTRVVMEATSDYWKPVYYLLEAHGFETWLVNARDVKHLPGRPKTDKLDAVWLCKVAERQMLRPSFVPPEPIRQLRDLTRYRLDLVTTRTAEKQRVEKLLEQRWGAIDVDGLKAVMADHANWPRSVCKHHAPESELDYGTIGSVVIDVTARTLWACAGNPCRAKWREVHV